MGSCFSSSSLSTTAADIPPTAKVIKLDGSLTEYSQPVKVSHILGLNQSSSFLCNADSLFYGQFIQSLGSDRLIEPGHLYFLLPAAKLEHRLTVAEMLELSASASSALAAPGRSGRRSRRRRKMVAEVSPIIETMDFDCYKRISEFSVGSWGEDCRDFRR